MARYFVIGSTFTNFDTPRVIKPGSVIEYSGTPGTTMIPLDLDAVAAKRRAPQHRIHARQERRHRARLSKTLAAKLAALEADRDRAVI
jgi:hypothetical protein